MSGEDLPIGNPKRNEARTLDYQDWIAKHPDGTEPAYQALRETGKLRPDIKSDTTSITVKIYEDGFRAGYAWASPAHTNERPSCQGDVDALRLAGYRVWILHHAFLAEGLQHRHLGLQMYEAVMAEGRRRWPLFALVPESCAGVGMTSSDAKRVWESLRRRWPTLGAAILSEAVQGKSARTMPVPTLDFEHGLEKHVLPALRDLFPDEITWELERGTPLRMSDGFGLDVIMTRIDGEFFDGLGLKQLDKAEDLLDKWANKRGYFVNTLSQSYWNNGSYRLYTQFLPSVTQKVMETLPALFHVTDKRNLASILHRGLIPHTWKAPSNGDERFHRYPARIFLAKNRKALDTILMLNRGLRERGDTAIIESDDLAVIEIDRARLHKGTKFYTDPEWNGDEAVYTYTHIPPTAIIAWYDADNGRLGGMHGVAQPDAARVARQVLAESPPLSPSFIKFAQAWQALKDEVARLQAKNYPIRTVTVVSRDEVSVVISVAESYVRALMASKEIPKGLAKKFELASRFFVSTTRTNDVVAWLVKATPMAEFLIQAYAWPTKAADSQSSFKVGPFLVHDTIGASDQELAAVAATITRAVSVLPRTGIRGIERVLYGNVTLVGQIKQSKTLAWYYFQDDEVLIRPFPRYKDDVALTLVHELGHRFWTKFMDGPAKLKWQSYHLACKSGSFEFTPPKVGDPLEGGKGESPLREDRGQVRGPNVFLGRESRRILRATAGLEGKAGQVPAVPLPIRDEERRGALLRGDRVQGDGVACR